MLKVLPIFQDIVVQEFLQLYQKHHQDHIYACALVFNDHYVLDDLALSTTRSLFSEYENPTQYLPKSDKWNAMKWRMRAKPNHAQFRHFKQQINHYFHTSFFIGQS